MGRPGDDGGRVAGRPEGQLAAPGGTGGGDCLRLWDGRGAVRLNRADRRRWALLVEACPPGWTGPPGPSLDDAGLHDDAAMEVAAAVLRLLWDAPTAGSPFELLADVAREWAETVRHRMSVYRPVLDPGIVDLGARLLETLPGTAARQVVLHGDFNPGNILAAHRQPWLAIDPKPMVGDPAYDPDPLLGQLGHPFDGPDADAPRRLQDRYRRFADLVGEPVERLLAWGVARRVESALWHVDRDEPEPAAGTIREATALARAAGL